MIKNSYDFYFLYVDNFVIQILKYFLALKLRKVNDYA